KQERLPQLAKELVALNPEVIFVYTTPATKALQKETRTIPTVFVNVSDPISENPSYPESNSLGRDAFAMLAPAKINLGLRVIGRRPDGYHEIETLLQEITLADRLEFYPAYDWNLEIRGADLDPGPDNLVTRAAFLLSQAAGVPNHARIVLHKEIPLAAGLGGGSSDAAVTLLGLSRLWKLNWDAERLCPLAARLGSDCPYFLYGGLVHAAGRGEALTPLSGRLEAEVVLVISPFGISTAWAYEAGRFPLTVERKSVIFQFRSEDQIEPAKFCTVFRNDLENIVLSVYDELGQIKRKLISFGAEGSLLSGSGSVVYGIFKERTRALHAAQQFGSPLCVRICRTVSRQRRT
ncbi:4-(cytidine 5'-diphospho)-2-C-methyl-D-erythritol kinase, partial [candidate division KSB1 bacterium]